MTTDLLPVTLSGSRGPSRPSSSAASPAGSFRGAGEELVLEGMDTLRLGLHKLSSHLDLKASGAGDASGVQGTLAFHGTSVLVHGEEAADLIEWLGKQAEETPASWALRKIAGCVEGRTGCAAVRSVSSLQSP